MALLAGFLFLLSLQTDSIKHLFPGKNITNTAKIDTSTADEKMKEGQTVKTVQENNKTKDEKEKNVKKEIETEKEKIKEKDVSLVQVKIYFLVYNEKADRIELHPVLRQVNARTPVKAALEELIKGPSKPEEKKGYVSAIPSTLKVIDVSIINNIAFINFTGALEEGAAGNIMLNRIDQIVYTATQFENVDGIHILINGQRKRFLGPDGISIAGPLKRH